MNSKYSIFKKMFVAFLTVFLSVTVSYANANETTVQIPITQSSTESKSDDEDDIIIKDSGKTVSTTIPIDDKTVSATIPIENGDSVIDIDITETKKEEMKPLTPNGNLTLVDDVVNNTEEDKQFITAVTKSGNYFYIVIDRAGKENNVYLLNLVDEADLMTIIDPNYVAEKPEPVDTTPLPEPKPKPTPEPVEAPPKKKNNASLFIGLALLSAGGAFYYIKFVKNKDKVSDQQVNSIVDEFSDEFDDEEEDEKYQIDMGDKENIDENLTDDDDEEVTI